jgi:hypothetical protein
MVELLAHSSLLQQYSNNQVLETAWVPHNWRMDEENFIYIYIYISSGVLFNLKEEWNYIVCR